MDLSQRVDEELSRILALIATPRNRRTIPLVGDAEGDFDFWFDGGASKEQTGSQHYVFSDGTRAVVNSSAPWLQIVVEFRDGRIVEINQLRERPEQAVAAQQCDRPAAWYCIFCGWHGDNLGNTYRCTQCGRFRPFFDETATMVLCCQCLQASLAVAVFCEWCGREISQPDRT